MTGHAERGRLLACRPVWRAPIAVRAQHSRMAGG
jgi:hypothetical protein